MATAGAGPSSAIASTSPRNEPEMRKRLARRVRKSLPTTTTASSPTSLAGCHCSGVESSTAATIESARTAVWPITRLSSRCLPRAVYGRAGGGSVASASARSTPPAARISASDQATITAHSATASQTITAPR